MPAARRSRLTRSARPRLAVVLHGAVAGTVHVSANRRQTFRYEDSWRTAEAAFPLSLSLPLNREEHGHQATSAFLWGLLPENSDVLDRWARLHGVSRNDAVSLLEHVGEDCAGAVQLVPPHELARVLGRATPDDERTSIEWLAEDDIADLLAGLRRNPGATRASAEQGQFSLAGAQPKTALYQDEHGRWGVPRGRVPSNRILKPPVLPLDDLAYNEHFCLRLARELGLPAVATSVRHFGSEIAIVVERYDRARVQGALTRVHQEDMCQALAISPTRKYESDGGPGLTDIASLLARHSSDAELDVARFLDAMILNWLIAGTDGHAKNYSLLHAPGPVLRLAPLYDVISALPYPQAAHGTHRLAMAVGGERAVSRIAAAHWRTVARAVGVSPELMLARVRELAAMMPDAIDRVVMHNGNVPMVRTVMQRLAEPVASHARDCLARLV
jgi:serine/threonine-protein kinase HipA